MYDCWRSDGGFAMEENDPLPDELALGGKSASQILSQTRAVEHSRRTFGISVTGMSVSVT